MSAKLLEGKPIADEIRARVKAGVEELKAKGKTPKLVAILAGENPGAKFYAGAQEKACAEVGIEYELEQLPADITQADLEGTDVRVPRFTSYVDRLVHFVRDHPEIASGAMA